MMKRLILLLILSATAWTAKAQILNHPLATGGFPIEITEAPYQVSIHNGGSHWCGGSVLNNRYVLTAAHCMFDRNGNRIPASSLTINVGLTLQNSPGSRHQRHNVRRIIIHPSYDHVSRTLDNDIALIEISGTFRFNSHVRPVTLISNSTRSAENVGNTVRVSGWGWDTPGIPSSSNQLRAVDVPIITNQEAGRQLRTKRIFTSLTTRMIATGAVSSNRRGACHEDSGGPLVFRQNGQPDILVRSSKLGSARMRRWTKLPLSLRSGIGIYGLDIPSNAPSPSLLP